MKRFAALLCALLVCFGCAFARGETAWTAEEWARVVFLLNEREPVPEEYRIRFNKKDLYLANPREKDEGWVNMLLLSTDAPDVRQNFGRAEAMLICRVNRKTGEVRMISLPEYALVPLPGMPEALPMKFAESFGGPLLALDTVNRALGLSLNRYGAVNINSFAKIVDAVGGVTMTLTEEEGEAMGLAPGEQRLTGEDVVHYVQFRREWEGGERFRALLEAVLLQAANGNMLNAALTVIDLMLFNLDTNLTIDEIAELIFALFTPGGLKDSSVIQLPTGPENTIDESVREMCRAFLYDGQ